MLETWAQTTNASSPRLEARIPGSGCPRALPSETMRDRLLPPPPPASHGWRAIFGVSSRSPHSGSRGAPSVRVYVSKLPVT